ncbi:hypothetical protein [Luteolibacter sp. LG18]|uniref:hypothetical protein n=1 Tax=Luteolibacter sp. LG18 TaxID=2819286 RepID=UPI0030C6A5E9
MASSVRADEATAAWHFAVSPVAELTAPGGPTEGPSDPFSPAPFVVVPEPGAVVAKEIPEPPSLTVFAAKGDRLFDLGPAFQRVSKMSAGSWVIWNETRHLLIAHGDLSLLGTVERFSRFERQPKMATLSFEWFRGNDPADKPVRRVECRGRSGRELAGSWKATDVLPAPGIASVKFSGQPEFADSPDTIDLPFKLEWAERCQDGDLSWSVDSGVSIADASSKSLLFFQVVSPSGETWRICGEAHRVLADGTLLREARWVERAGKAEALVPGVDDAYLKPALEVEIAGTKLTKKTYWLPVEAIKGLTADPSAADALSGLKEIKVPASLLGGIGGKLLDVKPLLKNCGIVLGERDWACYDPMRNELHLAVVEQGALPLLDQIDMLVEPGCTYPPRNVRVGLRMVEQGATPAAVKEMSVTGRSGRRAVVDCAGKGGNLLRWIVEPTIGDSDSLVDLHHECLLPAAMAGAVVEASANVTLAVGRDLEWQVSEAGGKRTGLLLRAEVVRALGSEDTR